MNNRRHMYDFYDDEGYDAYNNDSGNGRIRYKDYNPKPHSLKMIEICNLIINEYQADGFSLTLRQLFYQLVARDIVENTPQSYNRIGALVSKARDGGFIPWDAIEDRTRFVRSLTHWNSPGEIARATVREYKRDLWEGQEDRVEVWIEKDALIGVIAPICQRLDVPYFSTRGFCSASEMHEAARRHDDYQIDDGRVEWVTVLHLADHDPSGIEMTRDIENRLELYRQYSDAQTFVERIALNMNQIEEYAPPPNFAKMGDSRARDYVRRFGNRSWELDALDPVTLSDLIEASVLQLYNDEIGEKVKARQEKEREQLREALKEL